MKKKIFLFEEYGQNRDLAVYLLERDGYDVIPASNGALGLELALRHKPQLILLDRHLSSMDGHSVARALARSPALKSIPVVDVISRPTLDEPEKAIGSDGHGPIHKPFDPQTFVADVERYMHQAKRPRRRTGFWSRMTRPLSLFILMGRGGHIFGGAANTG